MIIDQPSEIVHNTTAHTADFSITTSPMLYKLLYTSLYEDKEKIVLQELAANALDAHIQAGKEDTPIIVSLPTNMNPVLEITDKGVGMSMETLTNVYPVYGASTKRETNDQIGGFGLGSKSPFALSSSFTVKTTCQGITTTVSCFLDSGQPKFSIFTSGDIGEEDGTTITVPINDEEVMRRMRNIVKTLYMLWDTPPIIHGTQEAATSYVDKEDDYFLIDTSSDGTFAYDYGIRHTLYVAVGPYMYRVPNAIRETLYSSEYGEKFKDLLYLREPNGTYLKPVPRFPIGVLELSPSRENIEATKENTEKISEAMVNLITSIDKTDAFDLKLYTEAVKIIDKKGLFYEGNGKILLGIDPEYLQPIINKVLGDNPTRLQSLWAMENVFVNRSLEDALKEMEPLDSEKLIRLTHDTTYRNPYFYDSATCRHISYYDVGRLWYEGKTNVAKKYSNLVRRHDTGASLIRETYNGRPSLTSGASLRGLEDLRDMPVLVDINVSTLNRQKLYNWWRTNPGYEKQETLVMSGGRHRAAVEWLDENFPRNEKNAPVATLADVETAWKNKPKPVRTASKKTSSGVRAARKPDPDTMYVGTVFYPKEYSCELTLGDLKAMNKDNTYQVVITSRRVKYTMYYLDSSANKYQHLPKKYFKGLPVLDISATLLKRKSVRLEIERLQAEMPVYFEDDLDGITKRLEVAPYKEYENMLDKVLLDQASLSMLNIPFGSSSTEALQYLATEMSQLFNIVTDPQDMRDLVSAHYVRDYGSATAYLNLLSHLPLATASRLAYTTQVWEMKNTAPDFLTATDKRTIITTINKLHKEGQE